MNPASKAWLVVALLWTVGCLNYLDRVMITTMRGSLVAAIPMTETQFGLLTTAFLGAYAILSPFAGFLADKFSRSRVIIGSLFVWSFVTWLTSHAKTYDHLLTTRVLMGISEACYVPASLALISDYHRGGTRSLANGMLLSGIMVGSSLGGLGGWLAERHSWQYAFSVFGLLGISYAVALAVFLRDPPVTHETPTAGIPPPSNVYFGEALQCLVRRGSFVLVLFYWGLLSIAGWMAIGWMPTYLQEHFHLTQGKAGLVATMYVGIASLLGLIIGGLWADRWSRTNQRACILVSVIGLCIAAPSVLLVAHTSVLAMAIVGLVVYGITSSFASTEMMPILCLISDSRYRATGYGVLNLFACLVGGATIYAGGVMRDMQINLSKLFQFGAIGLLVCAILLWFVRLQGHTTPQGNSS